jgi:hypothetical protein
VQPHPNPVISDGNCQTGSFRTMFRHVAVWFFKEFNRSELEDPI